ncbi:hypothetical protein [Thalassoroseus pseudoceratinae]|uniref:hypothetical protein n=1 Tax=Thalassoroseus pseudoceratinae TaxID=2713176 RepID=UPI0014218FDA|nr:hypothetical protein [Thalassoroseus pseudoceratinae]
MTNELQTRIKEAIADLPTVEEIRTRIAENIHERQILRQMLKLAEQRDEANALRHEKGDT